ncbi:GNAT family N-acetyltransferase [Paremcibacter congregatus]|uniref:GNAT family N-acetyltransferase n=1 Tax=Paremcibacter congregatus TaxID=2043170 RepID=UPI0030EC5DD5
MARSLKSYLMTDYHISLITSLDEISAEEWDSCCFTQETGHNPFISHAFMSALEDSGCAVADTGWQAQHIIARAGDKGNIVGVMPLYLKSHSYGEYVFDHAWANAFQSAGGHYYPKLQAAVPFSPVTTPKLLVHPTALKAEVQTILVQAAEAAARKLSVSSLHVTFAERHEWDLMAEQGFLKRQDQQFHWLNERYGEFDDFLQKLSSRKRKNIRKERRLAVQNDIEIELLNGHQITEDHWDDYFSFYLDTANRKWGQPYLNRRFFSLLGQGLPNRILLVMCKRGGRYIAGALNLLSDDTLYGRYWGAIEDHRYLHFEVCYYQAIEYAIAHGLKKVEAGAQGEHKLARGYLPTSTYSAHWIRDPGFRQAVENYLVQERQAVLHEQEILRDFTPFKKTSSPPKS